MTKFTVRILTAVITFAIGVAITTAWVFNHTEEPTIPPVEVGSDGPTILPEVHSDGPIMEMVFVLDTTGSMGGLLTGLAERTEIRKQILALSRQRTQYIAAQRKKRNGGAQNGFDVAVSAALRAQLAKKGIR